MRSDDAWTLLTFLTLVGVILCLIFLAGYVGDAPCR